jgi:hypothetical protein
MLIVAVMRSTSSGSPMSDVHASTGSLAASWPLSIAVHAGRASLPLSEERRVGNRAASRDNGLGATGNASARSAATPMRGRSRADGKHR